MVSGGHTDALPIPTAFVLANPQATSVRVVGDFNAWGVGGAPAELARDAAGVWSITLPLVPGRHLYAFEVDGAVVLDPRAAAAKDPDFGVRRSVVIVGKP